MLLSRGAALLLALCLLLTPLCAARCNLASCLPGVPQSTDGCHQQSRKTGGAASFSSVLATSCPTAESLFLTLPGQQLRLLHSRSNRYSLIASAALDSLPAKTSANIDPLQILTRDSSPGDSLPTPAITPLRL